MNQPRKPHGIPAKPDAINWREVCRKMLQIQRQLASHLLISDIEIPIEDELGNIEDDFFKKVLAKGQSPNSKGKRLKIIGEPGAGKTTQLLKIADWLLADSPNDTETELVKPLPIWISLAQVKKPLHQYLMEDWLREAAEKLDSAPPAWVEEFTQLLAGRKVCLLLDGADEMGITALLGTLAQSRISPLLNNVPMVISCRLNVWEAAGNALSDFDSYKMLGLGYGEGRNPDQVKQFIEKWFNNSSSILAGVERIEESQLGAALDEPGKERIKDLVRNPLHLSLLCFTWQFRQGELPDTKAELYQMFVEAFYELKKGVYPTPPAKRRNLNAALGQLALEAIKQGYKSILPHSLVSKALKSLNPELFEQALTLGWLNRVEVDAQNPLKCVYAFYHPMLLEYFAACEIEDWRFFFNPIPYNLERGNYRIFEPQWKEVFLLWLGRAEVPAEQKEELITALVKFDDLCGEWNYPAIDKGFYEYQAYFLAGAGITEFHHYSKKEEIVRQIVKWGFGELSIEKQQWQTYAAPITEAQNQYTRSYPIESLSKIDLVNSDAISALVQLIDKSQPEDTRRWAAESLGKIDPGNSDAISALVQLIGNSQSEDTRKKAAESLGKIGIGNNDAITALVELIRRSQNEFTDYWAAESLGKIGIGNRNAINALVELIRDSQSIFIPVRASENLVKIGTNNLDAITALVELIGNCQDEKVHRIVAESLRKIGIGNNDAINALVQLIGNSQDEYTRSIVAESLRKIGRGNNDAISALVQLTRNSQDEETRCWTAKCLRYIGRGNNDAINALVQLTRNSQSKETYREAAESLGYIGRGNSDAINALVQLIGICEDEDIRYRAAQSLWTIDPGNSDAINALIELTRNCQDEDIRYRAVESLGYIGTSNSDAISALIELTRNCQDEDIRRQAAESLGEIGIGNSDAISALIELTRNCQDEDIRRQAAESLGEIGIGNSDAISALIELTRNCQDEDIRLKAAKSLGTIDPGNSDAISALVQLTRICKFNYYTHRQVVESLGKIGIGNPNAINALVELTRNCQDEYTRREAAESLDKIDPGNSDAISALVQLIGNSENQYTRSRAIEKLKKSLTTEQQIAGVVSALKDYLSNETYENDFERFHDCYKFIWQCAQSLPYPEFYQAWHRQPPTHPEMPDITTSGNTPEAQ